MHPIAYRRDIDGLRALAVCAVVLYHVWPNWFPGGFVGVDIFFVISGFLITSIIRQQVAAGSFTVRGFYLRRVRRIFPALTVVLLATLAFGWLVLLQDEFRQLGKHALAGAGFVANLVLWSEAGYFDNAALSKPLLHLWSLGVEEQFYILWPLILVAARRRFVLVAALLFAASMVLNLATVSGNPSAAFFSPLSRFWELMAGGVVAHLLQHDTARYARWRTRLCWAGAALLIAAFAFTRAHMLFPGWWALLPVGGTCLLILAGPDAPLNRRLLSGTWTVRTGLISYPLYLWHWPLLAFSYIVVGERPPVLLKVGLVALALLLAIATYRWIELPLRAWRGRLTFALAGAMGSVAALGLAASTSVLRERIDAQGASAYLSALNESEFPAQAMVPMVYDGMVFQKLHAYNQRSTVFLGDSVMLQFAPRISALVATSPRLYSSAIFAAAGGCPPLPSTVRLPLFRNPLCARTVRAAYALAGSGQVDTVVIAAAWYGYFNHYFEELVFEEGATRLVFPAPAAQQRTLAAFEVQLAALRARGKRVFLVLQPPAGKAYDPRSMVAGSRFDAIRPLAAIAPFDRQEFEKRNGAVRQRLIDIATRTGARIIDPASFMCSGPVCPVLDESGAPIYTDSVHMRPGWSRAHAAFLDQTLLPDGAALTACAGSGTGSPRTPESPPPP